MSEVLKGALLAAFGALEGAAFVYSGMVCPQTFQDQMHFKSFTLMKIFLTGVATSMLAQSAIFMHDPEKLLDHRGQVKKPRGVMRVVAGSMIVGTGMFIAGSGPTIMPSQLVIGVGSAPAIVAGAFVGGALYGIVEPHITWPAPSKGPHSLDEYMETSYPSVAVPIAVVLFCMVAALEFLFPWSEDIKKLNSISLSTSISPVITGLVIGLNQIPIRLIANRGQGGTTAITNILNFVSFGRLYPDAKVQNLPGAGQLIYVWIGTAIGAALAASQTLDVAPEGCSMLRSFIGGAVIVVGARVARGCTCGHGITGFSELAFQSIAGAMAIFGGGIAAGALLPNSWK